MQVRVYFADNGCGMDLEGLKNAMKYGSKERVEKNSLGKFGLGLKTASTAFCKQFSLISFAIRLILKIEEGSVGFGLYCRERFLAITISCY